MHHMAWGQSDFWIIFWPTLFGHTTNGRHRLLLGWIAAEVNTPRTIAIYGSRSDCAPREIIGRRWPGRSARLYDKHIFSLFVCKICFLYIRQRRCFIYLAKTRGSKCQDWDGSIFTRQYERYRIGSGVAKCRAIHTIRRWHSDQTWSWYFSDLFLESVGTGSESSHLHCSSWFVEWYLGLSGFCPALCYRRFSWTCGFETRAETKTPGYREKQAWASQSKERHRRPRVITLQIYIGAQESNVSP